MKSVKITVALIGVVLASVSAAPAQTPTQSPRSTLSATKARDINGFELGMHIRDANKIAPMKSIGNDQFETRWEGVHYNFGVTPLGRIYRVQSTQRLGNFEIDAKFLGELRERLSAKYGEPQAPDGETFSWALNEPVERLDGTRLPFTTMWFSVYPTGGMDGVDLEMKMLDFRLLWADNASLNRAPRDEAIDALSF